MKVCIGCESPKGEKHETWCPVVTGTLNSLRDHEEALARWEGEGGSVNHLESSDQTPNQEPAEHG